MSCFPFTVIATLAPPQRRGLDSVFNKDSNTSSLLQSLFGVFTNYCTKPSIFYAYTVM